MRQSSPKFLQNPSWFVVLFIFLASPAAFGQAWSVKLDETVRFYQPTDMGAIIVGTKKSLYAIDAMTGDVLWRRKESGLDENDVAPVPGTDLLLLSFEKGERTRIEAADILTGDPIWQSEKLRGALMQTAVETEKICLRSFWLKTRKENLKLTSNGGQCYTCWIWRPVTSFGNTTSAKLR